MKSWLKLLLYWQTEQNKTDKVGKTRIFSDINMFIIPYFYKTLYYIDDDNTLTQSQEAEDPLQNCCCLNAPAQRNMQRSELYLHLWGWRGALHTHSLSHTQTQTHLIHTQRSSTTHPKTNTFSSSRNIFLYYSCKRMSVRGDSWDFTLCKTL